MKSGYKLFWSDRALTDLQNIINYLTETGLQKKFRILPDDSTNDLT
jgi:plasmid stabilization system protein ParE